MKFIALLLLGLIAACADTGTTPVQGPSSPALSLAGTAANGWYQTPLKGYGHSIELDFVSVGTTNETVPDSVRFLTDSLGFHVVIPDSIMVVNHSDRDTVYKSPSFYYHSGNYFYQRFYFYDGYTDRFQPTDKLDLSVFLHYQ